MSDRLAETIAEALRPLVAELVAEEVERVTNTRHAEEPPFLTVAEAADYLRTTRQRVYDLRSDGRLTAYSDGSRALVSRAELDAHIDANGRRGG